MPVIESETDPVLTLRNPTRGPNYTNVTYMQSAEFSAMQPTLTNGTCTCHCLRSAKQPSSSLAGASPACANRTDDITLRKSKQLSKHSSILGTVSY